MDILKRKENQAVLAHINMLQGIINRMAANSANCKTWSVTILAAMLILVVEDKVNSAKMWICYIPIGLFFFLDCFYLGLERSFIKKQNNFIDKINKGEDIAKELFAVKGKEAETYCQKFFAEVQKFSCQFCNTTKAIFSFSTLPFYGLLIAIVYSLT